MDPRDPSRRAFLQDAGALLGGSWIAMSLPALLSTAQLACQAKENGAAYQVLTLAEAGELEAIAAQIIPTDDTPGAREAGVIHFIDQALDTFMAGAVDPLRAGLDDFLANVRTQHAEVNAFSELPDDQQIAALKEIETTPFFGLMRYLTIAGMFSLPSHGGNRNEVGWQLLGFENRHAWQPPFGYYDENYDAEEATEG